MPHDSQTARANDRCMGSRGWAGVTAREPQFWERCVSKSSTAEGAGSSPESLEPPLPSQKPLGGGGLRQLWDVEAVVRQNQ